MPTNTELAKKIEQLEQNFENRISDIVEKVFARVCLKLEAQPGLTVENLKKEVHEHSKSLAFMNRTVEELETENKLLKVGNCTLTSKNAALEKRINDMEQYSRKIMWKSKGSLSQKAKTAWPSFKPLVIRLNAPCQDVI